MPITDDLIAWWELGEASGTRSDSHGANDLTDNNTVGSAAGVVGDAADLGNTGSNGGFTNESLSIADNADLSIAGHVGFTVCGWIRASNLAGLHTVLGKWNYNAAQKEYIVLANGTTLYLWASPDGSSETQLAGATLTLNTWHFFAAWHDPVADKIYLQVDGGTIAETAYSGGIFDGTSTFQIGGIAGVQEYGWGGQVDQIGFWKRVLTEGERAELYNAGAGVAYADLAGGGGEPGDVTGALTLGQLSVAGVAEREAALSASLALGQLAASGAIGGENTVSAEIALGSLQAAGALSREAALQAALGLGHLSASGILSREAALSAALALGQLQATGTIGTPALNASGSLALGALQAAGGVDVLALLNASLTLGQLGATGVVSREAAIQAALTLGSLRLSGQLGERAALSSLELVLADAITLSPTLTDALTLSLTLADA